MKHIYPILLIMMALAFGGCLPFSYIPNQPRVTTVAAKGQAEVAGTLSTDPLGYGQAEAHLTMAPTNHLLITAHAGAAGLEKDRHNAFIFFGNTRTYYDIRNRHLSAGLGLGTFGKWGSNATWYAQAGTDYAQVSTRYRYGYQNPDVNVDSGFVKAQGRFLMPWVQLGARFGVGKNKELWPRWSLIAAIRLSELLRRNYSYEVNVVNGNPLEEPARFGPPRMHLLMQAQFGGELALENGLAFQFNLSMANRQDNDRLLGYGLFQAGAGVSYCFGNRQAWKAGTRLE